MNPIPSTSRTLELRYTLKSLLATTTAIATWFGFVTYGSRVAGAAGGIVGGITMGLALALLFGAVRTIRTRNYRNYVASVVLLMAFPAIILAGYLILEFNAIFDSPDLTLTRNFQKLSDQLRHDKSFTNVQARIQREAIGGCVVLKGTVDSKDDLNRLESICDSFGHNAIWNRVHVSDNAK